MTHLGNSFPGNETFPTNNTEGGEWVEHDGKGMPVDGDELVEIRCRNEDLWKAIFPGRGDIGASKASSLRWPHRGTSGDIIAYRVVEA